MVFITEKLEMMDFLLSLIVIMQEIWKIERAQVVMCFY